MLIRLFKINPCRQRYSLFEAGRLAALYLASSAELAAIVYCGPYRRRVVRSIRRPVDLMIIGAQKSGTTWLHANFERSGAVAVSSVKECHHFDRGRMGSLSNYLRQFDRLPTDRPLAEVAPDYGGMSHWRVRALHALFPAMKVVFIARNPLHRAWSGTRMETTRDRGLTLSSVPVREMIRHLRSSRALNHGDYARQIATWRAVYGAGSVQIHSYDRIASEPGALFKSIIEGLAEPGSIVNEPEIGVAVFPGESASLPTAVISMVNRLYRPMLCRFAKVMRDDPNADQWRRTISRWHSDDSTLSPAPENERTCLMISGFTPNPSSTSAGQKIAYAKVIEHSQRFESVRLLYFTNELDILDLREPIEWPDNVTDLGALRIRRRDRIAAALLDPAQPLFVSVRRRACRRVLERELNDPAITDFYADFAQGLAPIAPADYALFAVRQHDILSTLYERHAVQASSRILRAFYRLEAWRTKAWEVRAWASVHNLQTLTEPDAERIRAIVNRRDVEAVPVRGSLHIDPAKRTNLTIVPGRIGFWGNMARHENVDAVRHFCAALLPAIQSRVPHVEFWIIGAHPTADVLALANDVVHVTGFVDDPSDLLASLDVAVAPLRLGSGVKIKVYETIDSGIPTVASPVGAEGVEHHPLLDVAEQDGQLVEMVIARLQRYQGRCGPDTAAPAETTLPPTTVRRSTN